MLKRTIAVIVAMLAVAITVPLAQAAPTKHHLKLTIKDATINSQGDRPGDKQSTAGLVTGQPFGQAVESITDKVTSATSTTVSFDGTITIYTSQGNLTGSIHIKITPTSTGANGTGTRQDHARHRPLQGRPRQLHVYRRRVRKLATVRVSRNRQRVLLNVSP